MDVILSWSSFIIIILCSLIFPLRIMLKYSKFNSLNILVKLYYILRKYHKILGFISIFISLIHCRISQNSTGIRSSFGAFLLILLISLALTYKLRKLLGPKWLSIHRFLTIILLLGVMFHSFIEF